MKSEDQGKQGEGYPLGEWMKAATDFWFSTASTWPGASRPRQESEGSQSSAKEDFKDRFEELWEKPLKWIQMFLASSNDPESLKAFFAGTGALPDIMLRMLRSGYEGYSKLLQQWLSKLGDHGASGEPYRFDNLDEDLFRAWMEVYQKEIQPLLHAPQLGLNRLYQERVHQTIDKYNLYQAALSEFMRLLSLPVEKSLSVMEKEIERLGSEGKLSENFKDYYTMWVKVLEGHYMVLFKSPDYLASLVRTLNTVEDFKMAQHKMLVDMLQVLPVPTNKDMDELYKEIYLLKKKVKQLSRKLETSESTAS